jgi:amidophosphoribosyltransferase
VTWQDAFFESAAVGGPRPLRGGAFFPSAQYRPFSVEQISQKIADMVKPKGLRAEFNILFQSVDKLHEACPNDLGDWYFTGNYPTPGGTEVANRAFVYYMEGRKERAY